VEEKGKLSVQTLVDCEWRAAACCAPRESQVEPGGAFRGRTRDFAKIGPQKFEGFLEKAFFWVFFGSCRCEINSWHMHTIDTTNDTPNYASVWVATETEWRITFSSAASK